MGGESGLELDSMQSRKQGWAVEPTGDHEYRAADVIGSPAYALQHMRFACVIGRAGATFRDARMKAERVAPLEERRYVEIRIDLEERVPQCVPVIDSESAAQLSCV